MTAPYGPAAHAANAADLVAVALSPERSGWWWRRRRRDLLAAAQVHATLATLATVPGQFPPPPPSKEFPVSYPTADGPAAAAAAERMTPPPLPRGSVRQPSWDDPTLSDHLANLPAAVILSTAADPAELLAPPPVVDAGAGQPVALLTWLRRYHPQSTGESGGLDFAANVLTACVSEMYVTAAGAVVREADGTEVPLASYFQGVDLQPGGQLQHHFLRALVAVSGTGVRRSDCQRLQGSHALVYGRTADGRSWPITPAVFDAVVNVLGGILADKGVPPATLGQLVTALTPVRTVLTQPAPLG